MGSVPKFYQVGTSHYNLDQIVKIESSIDLSSVQVNFSDGSEVEFKFDSEDEYNQFIHLIRSINFSSDLNF
ncbi:MULTISPECIES: hypothetical protein [Acinetobacter]|uniref:hypothetical protein n=1 Tax=Acinetobacter TaxID=469 RepID=UPI000E1035C8|nr:MULTISPECIES: hypothetical protein [Acinetobacter]AXJ89995.1 hypothetical protein DKP84_05995 [Acinetobacter pittii]MDO7535028.1 hypothetical protein [Acinetobacter pittii]MDS7927540.1 hypothetical protein [Acinetobacter sp. V115_6]